MLLDYNVDLVVLCFILTLIDLIETLHLVQFSFLSQQHEDVM